MYVPRSRKDSIKYKEGEDRNDCSGCKLFYLLQEDKNGFIFSLSLLHLLLIQKNDSFFFIHTRLVSLQYVCSTYVYM